MAQTTDVTLRRLTPLQQEREERDMALYRERSELTARRGQSLTQVNEYLMKKYRIHSSCTLYQILKRVERRLAGEGGAS